MNISYICGPRRRHGNLQYLFLEAVYVIQCPNQLVIECYHAVVAVHAGVDDDYDYGDDGDDDDGVLSWVERVVFLYAVAFAVVHVARQDIQ